MDELRLVRREDRSLVVATEAGEEFRLVVDDTVLAELRHLSRREPTGAKVRPREIQALIRAGKTRAEVIELTGLDESDIERYEGPVIAEREFILQRAHAVPVRTEPGDGDSEQFGEVIAERLLGIDADGAEWSAWRDDETGWMVGLDFRSRDIDHRAIWSFDHRKSVLAPVSPDAVTLSKQGDVGDRLIPKLRAVDAGSDGFDAAAFDAAEPEQAEEASSSDQDADDSSAAPNAEEEFERRREIDQRAISSSPDDDNDNLAQTADLLDALRRRRGERERVLLPEQDSSESAASKEEAEAEARPSEEPTPDASSEPEPSTAPSESAKTRKKPSSGPDLWAAVSSNSRDKDRESGGKPAGSAPSAEGGRGKRRASIPSWDDILFGTRGDDEQS